MGFSRKDESGDGLCLESGQKAEISHFGHLRWLFEEPFHYGKRDLGFCTSAPTEPGTALKLFEAVQSTLSFTCSFYLCPFH